MMGEMVEKGGEGGGREGGEGGRHRPYRIQKGII